MRDFKFNGRMVLPFMAVLCLLLAATSIGTPAALASGNPPSNVVPNSPMHKGPKLDVGVTETPPGRSKCSKKIPCAQVSPPPSGGIGDYQTDPVLIIGGLKTTSTYSESCTAYLANIRNYLQTPNHVAQWHPGVGTNHYVVDTGPIYMLGYYNSNVNCDAYLSTKDARSDPAPQCNNLVTADGVTFSNSDSSVGTPNEPIEHIACELSWWIYNHYSSQANANVKIVAHSMGGMIVTWMIQEAGNDPHFAPYVDVSDVVTFASPLGGLTVAQHIGEDFNCSCYESDEMAYDENSSPPDESNFMILFPHGSHPAAQNGTDWTMIGSLGSDPLDWDYQSTDLSNSTTSDNHRIGYDTNLPACPAQPQIDSTWYDHGEYLLDPCDGFDASYYYCDGCSGTQHSWFNYANADAPHSLHEMLFAFTYWDW